MRSALKPSRETDGIKDMIVDFHKKEKETVVKNPLGPGHPLP